MLKVLSIPYTEYEDYYDKARFALTWRINIILAIATLLMSVIFLFVNQSYWLHYFGGFIITSFGVVYLQIFRKYKTIALVLGGMGLLLVTSSVFLVGSSVHAIEPFWMIIITLYVYFTLGKRLGKLFLFLNLVAMTLFFNLVMNSNLLSFKEQSLQQTIAMSMEFVLCVLIIGYIIHQFISTNQYAANGLKQTNEILVQQNKLVELQNQEKTVLLQEIHHRVKNNLQVITSLLRMQSSEIKSEEAKSNFNDAINRIMTMALIHKKMYQEENLSKINVEDYFQTLTAAIIASGSVKTPVNIVIKAKLDHIGTKTIVPLALIVTELVTNSLKHAFEEGGSISLNFSEEVDKKFSLNYCDNGLWRESEKNDNDSDSSFGLDLIQILTEQLEGTYSRETNDSGTCYQFSFVNADQD